MRVLCISPNFVPLADSEAFCSAKVVRALLDRGVDVAVIASELSSSASRDHSALWHPFEHVTSWVPLETRAPVRSAISVIRYQTAAYARWVGHAVRLARQLHARAPFDLVYSRSLPMFSHVAGHWVARDLRLPWIANIDDPWDWHLFPEVEHAEYTRLQKSSSNHWLRRTLKCAVVVTYPSKRLWKFHEAISGIAHQAKVIPHIGLGRPRQAKDGKVVIVHAGKIGKNEATMRSAAGFFRALQRFLADNPAIRDKVEVVFVGPEDEETTRTATTLGLGRQLVTTGRVNYDTSLDIIGSANLCLLVEGGAREGIYLPSKLVDYVTSGKPVLALSPQDGTIADLTRFQGIYSARSDDDEAIQAILTRLVGAVLGGDVSSIAPQRELVSMFSEGPVVDGLVSTFQGVTGTEAVPRASSKFA